MMLLLSFTARKNYFVIRAKDFLGEDQNADKQQED